MAEGLHLSTRHRAMIEALLGEHLPGVEVRAYGSRVNGRSHDGSDLDLVLRGPGLEEIPAGQLGDFEEAVKDSTIPFLVEARDWARVPGRFLLTGSTDVLLVPSLAESLAGRLQIVRLHPFAQYELAPRSVLSGSPADAGFLHALFGNGFKVRQTQRLGERLIENIVAGGFPPALTRPTTRRRANWYRDYVETPIQSDVL